MTWQANGPACSTGTYCQLNTASNTAACVAADQSGADAGSFGGGTSDAGGTGGGGGTGSGGIQAAIACMQSNCAAESAACKADAKCSAGLACITACKDCDYPCLLACASAIGTGNAANEALGKCSEKANCGASMGK